MIHLILFIVLISVVLRLITLPFRLGRRRRFYGDNPYRYGCRRHHGVLGSVLPILALVAFDRLFTGRRF